MTAKSKRGGARPGSGRKPSGRKPKKKTSITIADDLARYAADCERVRKQKLSSIIDEAVRSSADFAEWEFVQKNL